MKNSIIYFAGLLISFSGCTANINEGYQSVSETSASVVEQSSEEFSIPDSSMDLDIEIHPEKKLQKDRVEGYEIYKDMLRNAISNTEIGIPDDFDKQKLSKGDIYVESMVKAKFTADESTECVLFGVKTSYVNWVLGLINDDGVVFQYIESTHTDLPDINFADIDGDGFGEIITNCDTLSTGSTSPHHSSSIFKWQRGTVKTLYHSGWTKDINLVDIGFEITFSNGYNVVVKNTLINWKAVLDGKKSYFFDDAGNVSEYLDADKPYSNLVGGDRNCFLQFRPLDIDNDGICEIIANEIFFVDLQMACAVGESYIVLKYNTNTGKLDVVKSAFWDYFGEATREQRQNFESSWYKS